MMTRFLRIYNYNNKIIILPAFCDEYKAFSSCINTTSTIGGGHLFIAQFVGHIHCYTIDSSQLLNLQFKDYLARVLAKRIKYSTVPPRELTSHITVSEYIP